MVCFDSWHHFVACCCFSLCSFCPFCPAAPLSISRCLVFLLFLLSRSLGDLMANMNCNATSAMQITHHFVSKMVGKQFARATANKNLICFWMCVSGTLIIVQSSFLFWLFPSLSPSLSLPLSLSLSLSFPPSLSPLSQSNVAASPPLFSFLPQVTAKLKGCVVYTSSAAASAPSPFSVLYAATKSFLASFGAGLAAEVRP